MVFPTIDLAQRVALPADERFALVQALWDSLRADAYALPLTAEERALIAAPRAKTAHAPDTLLQWEDIRAQLWADQTADEGAGEPGAPRRPRQ